MFKPSISSPKRRLALVAAGAALALLGGCAVVPATYDVGGPATVYDGTYVSPGYAYPAYPNYPAPYYVAPPLSVGVYGWYGRDRDRDRWDRPVRPGWDGHGTRPEHRPGPGARPPADGGHWSGRPPSARPNPGRPTPPGGWPGVDSRGWDR